MERPDVFNDPPPSQAPEGLRMRTQPLWLCPNRCSHARGAGSGPVNHTVQARPALTPRPTEVPSATGMLTYPSPTIQSHHGSDEPARADSHRVDHHQWVTGAPAAWTMADPPTKRRKRSPSPIPQRPACRPNRPKDERGGEGGGETG